MSLVIYGIKNCDTMKKARSWLSEQSVDVHFHDYRADGVPLDVLAQALRQLGVAQLINQRGTTWRALPEAERQIDTEAAVLALMQQHPAVIKRPLLQKGDRFLAGFSIASYQQFCGVTA